MLKNKKMWMTLGLAITSASVIATTIACSTQDDSDTSAVTTLKSSLATSATASASNAAKLPSAVAVTSYAEFLSTITNPTTNSFPTNATSTSGATISATNKSNDDANGTKVVTLTLTKNSAGQSVDVTITGFSKKASAIKIQATPYESAQRVIKSSFSTQSAYDKIKELVKSSHSATVFGEVDHMQNSTDAKLTGENALITFNKVLVFGNATSGTNLMVNSPGMGLELPLRIQVYTDDDKTYVNTNATVANLMLHGQNNQTLATNFVNAVNKVIDEVADAATEVTLVSESETTLYPTGYLTEFEYTPEKNLLNAEVYGKKILEALKTKIEGAGNKIFVTVNHVKNDQDASGKGRLSGVNTVLIFGNAAKGTALMLPTKAMGLELPLRIQVYTTDDHKVMIATNATTGVLTKYKGSQSSDVITKRNTQATNFSATIKTLIDTVISETAKE